MLTSSLEIADSQDSKDAGIADSKAAQGEVVDNKVADDEAADNKVASTDSEVVDGELQVKGKDGGREYETRYIIAKEIRIVRTQSSLLVISSG